MSKKKPGDDLPQPVEAERLARIRAVVEAARALDADDDPFGPVDCPLLGKWSDPFAPVHGWLADLVRDGVLTGTEDYLRPSDPSGRTVAVEVTRPMAGASAIDAGARLMWPRADAQRMQRSGAVK